MILLNTHIWVNWILLGREALKPIIASAIEDADQLASYDTAFPNYPELVGYLLTGQQA